MAFTTPTSLLANVQNNLGSLKAPAPVTPANIASQLLTPQSNNIAGSTALAQKAQSQYSNKQFVSPFSYQQNIEGTFINVDYLGKKILTNGSVPYRAIRSLSAIPLTTNLISDPSTNNPNRLVKTAPTTANAASTNAAAQQLTTGANALVKSFSGRTSQFTTTTQSNNTQIFGNVINNGIGELQTSLPISSINQTVSKLPGLNIITNSLGQIPGGTDLTKVLSSPIGAATGVLQQTLANSIQIQGGLPSVSLGSLGTIFNDATNIASSGPPTSLTGLISLEKQVKGIVCNFTLPTIAGLDFNSIIHFKFHKPDDIMKQIKKQLEDLKSKIINQLDIVQQLKNLIPDPYKIYDAIVKELTTCDNNPVSKNNIKSGKPSTPAPATPSLAAATKSPVTAQFSTSNAFKFQSGTNTGTGPVA
jgi:hypothetical protein